MTTRLATTVLPCCGSRHALPFQHRKWFAVTVAGKKMMRPFYIDAKGKRVEVLECARCFKTLEKRGLRPSNVRWSEPGSNLCKACQQAVKDELDAQPPADEDVFALVAHNRQAVLPGWWP